VAGIINRGGISYGREEENSVGFLLSTDKELDLKIKRAGENEIRGR